MVSFEPLRCIPFHDSGQDVHRTPQTHSHNTMDIVFNSVLFSRSGWLCLGHMKQSVMSKPVWELKTCVSSQSLFGGADCQSGEKWAGRVRLELVRRTRPVNMTQHNTTQCLRSNHAKISYELPSRSLSLPFLSLSSPTYLLSVSPFHLNESSVSCVSVCFSLLFTLALFGFSSPLLSPFCHPPYAFSDPCPLIFFSLSLTHTFIYTDNLKDTDNQKAKWS